MTTPNTRLEKLEKKAGLTDWRAGLPAGVTAEEAERVQYMLARELVDYADRAGKDVLALTPEEARAVAALVSAELEAAELEAKGTAAGADEG